MAMFDMPDYVYTASGARLSPAETPLGKWLLHARALTPEALQAMKSSPLMRRRDSTLLYVPGAGRGMRLEQISALVADLPLSSAGGGQGTTPGGAPA